MSGLPGPVPAKLKTTAAVAQTKAWFATRGWCVFPFQR